MFEITGLNTGYGDIPILHDLNLIMQEREILMVLGPNGHGKTTLLRTISGLLRAWSGHIMFGGVDLTSLLPNQIVQQGIAHIPQGDLLFPDMTVMENLLMGAYLPETWKNRREQMVEVFKMFPSLEERSGQIARTLSGGERRMLALGRGMMVQARLYLIDEPSLGLAPLLVENLYKDIRKLVDRGLSIILVEENASRAAGLADRVYLMESGRFVRSGHPEDLLGDEAFRTAYLGI
jgi:branched-chain amino acid transport system ATP-binding protein